jgi:putative flippase GtrA
LGKSSEKSFGKRAKKLIIRYIKFNIVGVIVFLVASVVFMVAFSTFGVWTWLLANGIGGVLQFSLINYLNSTKKGRIFDNQDQGK